MATRDRKSKKLSKRGQKVPAEVPYKLTPTKGVIEDVFDQAEAALSLLVRRKIKVEEARVIANLLKVKVTKMELELTHAKLTDRLRSNSPYLPNFIRSGARVLPAVTENLKALPIPTRSQRVR